MSANKILIVEDDTPIAELLAYRHKKEGYDAVSYTHLTLPTT